MNHLYFGDNLTVLRDHIPDESVDLIYLDPPFNSNANYSHLYKDESGQASGAQVEAFEDTWHWDDLVSGQAVAELRDSPYQDAANMLDAMLGFLGKNPMTAYLAMMSVRLVELHRVLKPTGSLYLHCDPTASHYLKLLLDGVFGAVNFRNEVVWKRTSSHNDAKNAFADLNDTILFYGKTANAEFIPTHIDYDPEYIEKFYRHDDEDGKGRYRLDNMASPSPRPLMMYEWKGYSYPAMGWRYQKDTMSKLDAEGRIYYPKNPDGSFNFKRRLCLKRYLKEQKGPVLGNVWTDINPLSSHAKERLGYPTQKPVALLERILQASSNEGDVVLDPFCGCGTTVHAAQKLNRQWIGIDITHLAINLIETRLYDAFGDDAQFTVHGVPKDLAGAQDLFDRDDATKKQFEKWACGLIKAYPQSGGKKGADGGVDGIFRFGRDKEHSAIVSVKGGKKVDVKMIRELDAVVTERKAQIGVLLTLTPPTKPMQDWAAQAGTFEVEGYDPVPRLQIITVEDALDSGARAVNVPLRQGRIYKAAAQEQDRTSQGVLDL